MKKLTLDLDTLVVESFEVPSANEGNGTVRGHESAEGGSYQCTAPNQYTCMAGCIQTYYGPGNTCYETCYPLCTGSGHTCDGSGCGSL